MINADDDPQDILQQCLHSSHTRLPVFQGDPENIVGVIHAKDLLRAMYKIIGGPEGDASKLRTFKLSDVAMKPYFVPETSTLDEQMRQFLRRLGDIPLAAVIDRNDHGRLRVARCQLL